MRTLRLVGLSQDSREVVFTDGAGVEYAAPADDRLRAALRGDRARLGQLEIDMESALRPRDIQARIRAGDTPESVAALAGVPVERITAYVVPVLAERRHVAELAGRSHVRRANADGAVRRLEEVVAERLRGRGIRPDSAEWDAWRRDDGRWTVQASYHSGERLRTAAFVFDLTGRFSLADDDEAKWLTGERQHTSKGPQPREAGKPHERRLAAVPSAEPEGGPDLLTLSEAQVDLDGWIDRLEPAGDAETTSPADADTEPMPTDDGRGYETTLDQAGVVDAADEPVLATDDHGASEPPPGEWPDDTASRPGSGDWPDDTTDDLTAVVRAVREAGEAAPVSSPEAPTQRRRRTHATVPSWDEIMLGGRRGER